MSVAIIAIIAVLLVLGVGYLIFVLMRKSQTVVPQVTDEDAASRDPVVEHRRPGARDRGLAGGAASRHATTAGFENLLKDELARPRPHSADGGRGRRRGRH